LIVRRRPLEKAFCSVELNHIIAKILFVGQMQILSKDRISKSHKSEPRFGAGAAKMAQNQGISSHKL
jgi:ribosome maturation protein Sdo1